MAFLPYKIIDRASKPLRDLPNQIDAGTVLVPSSDDPVPDPGFSLKLCQREAEPLASGSDVFNEQIIYSSFRNVLTDIRKCAIMKLPHSYFTFPAVRL